MKNNCIKNFFSQILFPEGSIRKIFFGPLRGFQYRISPISGLSPLYSGTERDQQNFLKSQIQSGNTVMDIGANWGLHTLLMSQLVGTSGKVIAIEPAPLVYEDLKFNLELNDIQNVELHQIAASDSEGEVNLHIGISSGLSSIVSKGLKDQKQVLVQMKSMDSVLEKSNIKNLHLIKIDVEGAESLVLKGLEKTLEKFKPTLLIELHNPEQDLSVAGFLVSHGYDFQRLKAPPILRKDLSWPHREGVWGTLIATPLKAALHQNAAIAENLSSTETVRRSNPSKHLMEPALFA